jgi:Mrp family chromosome partitioning ATPase
MSLSSGNICDLRSSEASRSGIDGTTRWEGSRQHRRDCIDLLRREFDYTIVDCPSLKESGDVLSIAPFVDGVVLVVEANYTRRDQLQHAEHTIEAAQGNILGHILNKRTYEIPNWIYRRL